MPRKWWEYQLRGDDRFAIVDWGECMWTAADLLDEMFRLWYEVTE